MRTQLLVYGMRGERKTIDLCDTEEQFNSITVQQLKEKIKEEFGFQSKLSGLRLIYTCWDLEEDALLSKYGIRHLSEIRLVQKLAGGGSLPVRGDGGMGDKDGKNRSMETLMGF